MGLLDKISGFKVNGAIDAQFRTNLAVERVLIAQGKKAGGITSWLVTIEYIGMFLALATAIILIAVYIIIGVSLFLINVGKFIYYSIYPDRRPKTEEELAQEDMERGVQEILDRDNNEYQDTTEEEEERMANFY